MLSQSGCRNDDGITRDDICEDDVFVLKGTIRGDVNIRGRVRVPATAWVRGEVAGDEVVIEGRVDGSVRVSGKLVLKHGSIVMGNVSCDSLVLEEGARLEGRCNAEASAVPELILMELESARLSVPAPPPYGVLRRAAGQ